MLAIGDAANQIDIILPSKGFQSSMGRQTLNEQQITQGPSASTH